MKSKVLVLAGGNVKAAFQAGVIKSLFDGGYKPEAIYGISAGSLNATFITNQLGIQMSRGRNISFPLAAKILYNFWENEVTGPEKLWTKLSLMKLGWTALKKEFQGLVQIDPLKLVIDKYASKEFMDLSPINIKIGAVDIMDGKIKYIDKSDPYFFDFLLASCSVPILMPVKHIEKEKVKESYYDGGLRDVAPLKQAILDGAEEIVCIANHGVNIDGGRFNTGSLLDIVDRVMDIAVNEILNADINEAILMIEVKNNKSPNNKTKLVIIRPTESFQIIMDNFGQKEITHLLEMGYLKGKEFYDELGLRQT
ncbi:MAG: hypothetical protein RIR51_1046 [Bacteroidota bacterium]|jgi:NTE family protein